MGKEGNYAFLFLFHKLDRWSCAEGSGEGGVGGGGGLNAKCWSRGGVMRSFPFGSDSSLVSTPFSSPDVRGMI